MFINHTVVTGEKGSRVREVINESKTMNIWKGRSNVAAAITRGR